jgi:hypothetical protein
VEYLIRFGDEAEGVRVTASGTSDLAGQMGLFEDVVGDARYSPGMPILVDYSGLDERRAPSADVEQLGRFIAGLDAALGDAKLAIVVPDTVAFGLGRMSQARIETRVEIQFFYDRDEAEGWLHEGAVG